MKRRRTGVVISVRLPISIVEKLDRKAGEMGCNRSDIVRHLLWLAISTDP